MIPSKPQNIGILWGCCKLYHKTTWFETRSSWENKYFWILGCKLYHKTTWFETRSKFPHRCHWLRLQIISQNYVVWNAFVRLSQFSSTAVANYITKLRGLKPKFARVFKRSGAPRCKLYHKTTWFETTRPLRLKTFAKEVANYITKLRGLKHFSTMKSKFGSLSCKLYHKTTWFETNRPIKANISSFCCKLYHKTTWFETLCAQQLRMRVNTLQIISQNYVVWNR